MASKKKNNKQTTPPTPPAKEPEGYRVSLMRDTHLAYPELWLEVHIEGDEFEQQAFSDMFVRARCRKARSIDTADLVVFTGGEDVNPVYYAEDRHHTTFFDSARDEADLKVYEKCLSEGIPMLGVCRGAQFLHVMNGGKLYQDLDGHNKEHSMWDIHGQVMIQKISSVHHQACIPFPEGGMDILADAVVSHTKWRNPTDYDTRGTGDVEAFFYRDTCCFGVQGHPEYKGYTPYRLWVLDKINELIICSPDIVSKGGYYRLTDAVLAQREANWAKNAKELN